MTPVKALATRTGETAHLAVREGREVFFIDHHASGDQGVIVPGQTGKLMPLHCTAHGKSLLADFGLAELKALYGSDSARALHRPHLRLAAGPRQGVRPACEPTAFPSTTASTWKTSRCVAAPIRDRGGLVIGSIGVSAPATRMSERARRSVWLSTSVTPPNTSTRCSERQSADNALSYGASFLLTRPNES